LLLYTLNKRIVTKTKDSPAQHKLTPLSHNENIEMALFHQATV
jgi:hypothetical protein